VVGRKARHLAPPILRKLHIGIDAESGEIVAVELTKKEVDDAALTGELLDQITDPIASFTADGAYDQDTVYEAVGEHAPDAAIIVPPRSTAVPSPPPKRLRRRAINTSRTSPSMVEWLGKNPKATIAKRKSKRRSVDTNA
jgi:Transposase DDE domain